MKNLLNLPDLDLTGFFDSATVDPTALTNSLLLEFDDIIGAASIPLTAEVQENATA